MSKDTLKMTILTLITEAKKITPTELNTAHAWLDDLQATHKVLTNPVIAIRFFMLGLHASGIISLTQWDEFDSLIASKNKAYLH